MTRSPEGSSFARLTSAASAILKTIAACSLSLAAAAGVGCGDQDRGAKRDNDSATEEISRDSMPDSPPRSDSEPLQPRAPSGWPAGDEPAAAVDGLGEHIKQAFTEFHVIGKQIYPIGWTKLRYKPESVTTEITETESEGKPKKAAVRIKYQKLSSIIHPTEDAAKADEDLLPYPAEETREAMTGRRFAKPWPPIEGEITYELKDGRWMRVDYKTAAVGREGADWLDRIGVP